MHIRKDGSPNFLDSEKFGEIRYEWGEKHIVRQSLVSVYQTIRFYFYFIILIINQSIRIWKDLGFRLTKILNFDFRTILFKVFRGN